MKIRFSLGWVKFSQASRKYFKSSEVYALVNAYVERIAHFIPCEIGAYSPPPKDACLPDRQGSVRRLVADKDKSCLWVCEREKGSRSLSSEALARELQKVMNSGIQELQIVVGGPDGYPSQELDRMAPALRWSFGPLTFPHELAAVVASEQIYRALTILHHQPYHSGH